VFADWQYYFSLCDDPKNQIGCKSDHGAKLCFVPEVFCRARNWSLCDRHAYGTCLAQSQERGKAGFALLLPYLYNALDAAFEDISRQAPGQLH
jgi:hypothetical protein